MQCDCQFTRVLLTHLDLCAAPFLLSYCSYHSKQYLPLPGTVLSQVYVNSFTFITRYQQSSSPFVGTVHHHLPFSIQPREIMIYIKNTSPVPSEANLRRHLPFFISSFKVCVCKYFTQHFVKKCLQWREAPNVRPTPSLSGTSSEMEDVVITAGSENWILTSGVC